jgi:hypothetical protein
MIPTVAAERATLDAGTFVPYPGGPTVRLRVTLELAPSGADRQTVDHGTAPAGTLCLAVQGTAYAGTRFESGGQNRDDLRAVIERGDPALPREDLASLLALWERWHCNDLKAGCVHQAADVAARTDEYRGGARYGTPEYRAIMAEQQAACPLGYRWGSEWLTEPLPADVVAEVRRLMALPQPDGK